MGRDCRWSVTLQQRRLAQWVQAGHISTCASRDCCWSKTLQWRQLARWGRRWVYGDPIKWDPKVQVTCPRVGHVSVHAEGTWHWAVAKMHYRVGVSSSCPYNTSPRTDGSKETSVEAARATPFQQQVLLHSRNALGMQLGMRHVCGGGAVDVGSARCCHGAVHAQDSAHMIFMAPGDVIKCMSMSPCVL